MTSSRPSGPPSESLADAGPWVHRLACLLVVLAAGALYLNTVDNPFVYDDHRVIVANRSLVPPTNWHALLFQDASRPVVNISYAVDRRLWGPAPFGFHVTNILLHVLNTAALVALVRQLATRAGEVRQGHVAAVLAGALFAVHPMMTEAVGYIASRPEVLCGTFSLLSLLAFVAAARPAGVAPAARAGSRWRPWSVVAAFACWLLALGCKEIAVMVPVVALFVDRQLLAGTADERQARLWRLHAPWMALTVALALLRLVLFVRWEHGGLAALDWRLGAVEVDVVRQYLAMLLWPTQQSIFHAVPAVERLADARVISALATLAALLGAAWLSRRRWPMVSVGLLWFLAFLVPSALLVVLDRGEPMAEHRVYLASAGLFMAMATTGSRVLSRLPWRRPAGALLRVALVVHLCLLAARTYVRNGTWGDPVLLWSEASMLAPDHWLPYIPLGEAMHAAGRHGEAIGAYATALRLRPEERGARRKLGVCLVEVGDLAAAAATFEQLQRQPSTAWEGTSGLALVALARGDLAAARAYADQARRQHTTDPNARETLDALDTAITRMAR